MTLEKTLFFHHKTVKNVISSRLSCECRWPPSVHLRSSSSVAPPPPPSCLQPPWSSRLPTSFCDAALSLTTRREIKNWSTASTGVAFSAACRLRGGSGSVRGGHRRRRRGENACTSTSGGVSVESHRGEECVGAEMLGRGGEMRKEGGSGAEVEREFPW